MVRKTEVNGETLISFVIGDMPLEVYQQFTKYAERYHGNTYWSAIKVMMDNSNVDNLVYTELEDLKVKVEHLETKITELTTNDQEPEEEVLEGLGSMKYK